MASGVLDETGGQDRVAAGVLGAAGGAGDRDVAAAVLVVENGDYSDVC